MVNLEKDVCGWVWVSVSEISRVYPSHKRGKKKKSSLGLCRLQVTYMHSTALQALAELF